MLSESTSNLGIVIDSFTVNIKSIHSPYKEQTTQEKWKSLTLNKQSSILSLDIYVHIVKYIQLFVKGIITYVIKEFYSIICHGHSSMSINIDLHHL